jgi:serine/threonine-protein kinase RsbW
MTLADCAENSAVKSRHKDEVVLVLPNKPDYVSVARLTVSGIAGRMGFDVETVEDIKLALAEACTNAIKHGCCEESKEYKVKFGIEPNCLTICVSDKGCGVDKKEICGPDFENPKEGGLGIFIIDTLMDDVELHQVPGSGFTITMKKNLGV